MQCLDGGLCVALQRVGDADDPNQFSIAGDQDGGFRMGFTSLDLRHSIINGDAVLSHQPDVSDNQRRVPDPAPDTLSGDVLEIVYPGECDVPLVRRAEDRLTERVLGEPLQAGGDSKNLV